MRNRESEGYTDSPVEDSAREPLLSRQRVRKTFPLESPTISVPWIENQIGQKQYTGIFGELTEFVVLIHPRGGRAVSGADQGPGQGVAEAPAAVARAIVRTCVCDPI